MAEKSEKKTQSLAKWDPFADLDRLERFSPFRELAFPTSRMARLVDDFFGERLRTPALLSPPMDITESEEAYVISVEVPGVKKDDLTLEVQEGILSIRGEKKSEREEKKDQGRWLERSYGSFSRSFSLPSNADADKISAKFEDGVLRITLPKAPEAKAKTVAIKS